MLLTKKLHSMRKILLIIVSFLFTISISAQITPMERTITKGMVKVTDDVGDFTITDSDGNSWSLYEQIDLGKTVFLDLFFST